ncbi:hypothetical protein B0H11DRAFT_1945156 [Mycena galericulata]|nr:hypothetical protein B0H11DRAFT_1945156 [Mycena galericulata]
MPAQRSHKKGKSKKSRDPPPPPPFRFQGARLAWLQPQIDAFLTALHRGRLHTFLPDLYERYWKNFPWRLPIEEEPYPGMAFDDDLLELSTTERIQRDYVVAPNSRLLLPSANPSHNGIAQCVPSCYNPRVQQLRFSKVGSGVEWRSINSTSSSSTSAPAAINLSKHATAHLSVNLKMRRISPRHAATSSSDSCRPGPSPRTLAA